MTNPLLDRATPRQLAEQRQVIELKGDLQQFPRLAAIVEADLAHLAPGDRPPEWQRAPVELRLEFGFADARQTVPQVEGWASAELDAVCQRCLETFKLSVAVDLKYLLLTPGDEAADYEDYEAWELDDKRFRPLDVVEEALIMTLPLAAVHSADENCGAPLSRQDAVKADRTRPFEGLRERLKDSN